MSDVKVTLELLIQGLQHKLNALKQIEDYSKQQEELLKVEEIDYRAFNNIMKNKEVRIKNIVKIDEGFKPAFERIQGTLNNQTQLYKEEIGKMQGLIKEISDVSVSVQVIEGRNKNQFDMKASSAKGKVKDFRQSKQVVSSYYDNIKKQKKVDQSFFFDTKH